VVVSRTEKTIPAIAAARGVFSRARVKGPSCCRFCSIRHTSKPRSPLPPLRGNEAGPKGRTRLSQILLCLSSRRNIRSVTSRLIFRIDDPPIAM
jgi:hypothetical protein